MASYIGKLFYGGALLALLLGLVCAPPAWSRGPSDQSDRGVELVLEVRPQPGQDRARVFEQVSRTITQRLQKAGFSKVQLQLKPAEGRLVLRIPAGRDPRVVKDLASRTGLLEFKLVLKRDPSRQELSQPPAGAEVRFHLRRDRNSGRLFKYPFLLRSQALLTSRDITAAKALLSFPDSQPYVMVRFNQQGAAQLAKITAEHKGQALALVMDGRVLSAPVIQEAITGGEARIAGVFNLAQAQALAVVLSSGPLAAPVMILAELPWPAR